MTEQTAMVLAPIAEVRRKLEDREYLTLIKDSLCPKASDLEFKHCMATAHHLGLDPIARQIFFFPVYNSELRRMVWVPVVAVAGLLAIAQRTGEYQGRTAPEWCGQDGKWRDIWLADGPPAAARVSVHRNGFVEPVAGVVMYREYCRRGKDGSPMAQWKTMPAHMLYKCALSQALRHSWSQEMAGDYGIQGVSMPGEPGQFRERSEADEPPKQLPAADIDAVIAAIREAPNPDELNARAQKLKDIEMTEAQREDALDAWKAATGRIGKALGVNVSTKPSENDTKPQETEPAPEHDYGPPAMTDGEAKKAQDTFGFDD